MRGFVRVALVLVRFAAAVALLVAAWMWRSPIFAALRAVELPVLIVASVLLVGLAYRSRLRPASKFVLACHWATAALAAAALLTTLAIELRFQSDRYAVLHAEPGRVERLGRHVIVGYRDIATLHDLVRRRAVAGVFISRRNTEGQSAVEVARTIQGLQAMRAEQGLAPLWIATDQEGGIVSRLSPPLPQRVSLAETIAKVADAQRQDIARRYGAEQGRELAGLGVTLNFAPVVDLDHGVVNPNDTYTRISRRAIAKDPALVTDIARAYCAGLRDSGVRCTLKHFPGLGRVYEDTHVADAELTAPVAELERSDWIPFRALLREGEFAMLAHVRLAALDRERPASASPAVIAGLLRGAWGHDGVLLTDDFSMAAMYRSRDGIRGAGVGALNAGIDLILLSYDPEQYFPVMAALLAADRDGRMNTDGLARSAARLTRASSRPGTPRPVND